MDNKHLLCGPLCFSVSCTLVPLFLLATPFHISLHEFSPQTLSLSLSLFLLKFIYLFDRDRNKESGEGAEGEGERIPNRLDAASAEPDTGLELTKP